MDFKSPAGPSTTLESRSAAPPAYSEKPPVIKPLYVCMTLNRTDRIRLINCPQPTIDAIREVVSTRWSRGIDKEQNYYGAHEWKMHGNPFQGFGNEAILSRQLMCAVLSRFYHLGWSLVASTDVTKKQLDKDSLFFKTGDIPAVKAEFFSITFNEGDKLRLIDSPPVIIEAVRTLLGPRIQREEWKVPNAGYQFKMRGWPWYAEGSDTVATRVLLLQLLDVLAAYGWELHATVDMSIGNSEGMDTDTWFLRKVVT